LTFEALINVTPVGGFALAIAAEVPKYLSFIKTIFIKTIGFRLT